MSFVLLSCSSGYPHPGRYITQHRSGPEALSGWMEIRAAKVVTLFQAHHFWWQDHACPLLHYLKGLPQEASAVSAETEKVLGAASFPGSAEVGGHLVLPEHLP